MGRTSGSNQLSRAADAAFAGESKPLTPVQPCKKGQTLLKVFLSRIDTGAAIGNETVLAGLAAPGAAKTTAPGTGLADYGAVKPGTYSFGVSLSPGLKDKYEAYATRQADVPKQVDFHATLKLLPLASLRIVVFDAAGAKVSGAAWQLTEPVARDGKTGADGLIDVQVPWDTTAAKLSLTLPKGKRIAKPTAVPADDATQPPPYPVTLRPEQWDPPPQAAPEPAAITWTAQVRLLPDADDDDGARARLANLGFPAGDAERTKRSVRAFHRLHKQVYDGSGLLADIQADLKAIHDTV
ncbi:MAG: hypothetical protein Q8M01_22950 [Rubrivivax sp.]|nr:hypothetical protein [Rubrivivax sp.]